MTSVISSKLLAFATRKWIGPFGIIPWTTPAGFNHITAEDWNELSLSVKHYRKFVFRGQGITFTVLTKCSPRETTMDIRLVFNTALDGLGGIIPGKALDMVLLVILSIT